MKFFYVSLALLTTLASAATLPELEGKTPTPVPPFCELENLTELVKCSCFVEASEGTITDVVKNLCVIAFGEDLLALEGSCKGYVEGGKIDVAAVRKDVVKADEICVPLYTEIGGISRQIETAEHTRVLIPLNVKIVSLLL